MGGLTLLHPLLLAGLAAAALPILIHLIGRRRAPVIFFAAMDFLAAVNKRLARRERLRQILLLILRTLALIALVLALARPVPPRPSTSTASNRNLAVVLDTSGSMTYQRAGQSLLDHGKQLVGDLLSHLQPGDMATIVTAGPEVRPLLSAPTTDIAMARTLLDAVDHSGGVADLGAAMDVALSQFRGGPAGVTLVVVSDLAENSFRNIRPSTLEPPPEVRLVDAAQREQPAALGNLAIENVTVESSAGSANERRFTVLIHNYGSTTISGRNIELVIDGEVKLRGYVEVGARAVAAKVFTYAFSAPGVYDAEVRLPSDNAEGYQLDDRYFFGVEIVPGVRVLAVDGDPSATPYDDELFFLERALTTVPKGDPFIDLHMTSVDEFAAAPSDLAKFDVVVLANVGALPAEAVARLSSFVEGGGGVLFTLGDKIQFERANAVFGSLFPHPLRDLHLADDPAARTPPLGIASIDWDHPIMRSLGAAAEESLRSSRTARYFNLDVGADRHTRPILRFDNGAPALVEAQRPSRGRVMMLTTSIDRDMSDIVLRSVFPALLQRTVRYLAKAVDSAGRLALRQGAAAEVPLPTGVDAMGLVGPHGARRLLQAAAPNRVTVRGLDDVGFYRAETSRAGRFTREPRLDIGVSSTLDESDFSPVQPAQVAAALGKNPSGRGVEVSFGAAGSNDPFDVRGLGSLLLLAVCFLFVSESVLASRG